MEQESSITKAFGNKLRVRICGICIQNGTILLVKHTQIGDHGYLWSPPGGGLQFGESVEECLLREFMEETGLTIKVNEFLFIYEFLQPPLHALELFFRVEVMEGELTKGTDPELPIQEQVIEEVKFCDQEFINSLPSNGFHPIIGIADTLDDLASPRGFYPFK